MGKKISKDSLYGYLSYYEDCYTLFQIPLYTFSTHKQMVNPKKIYVTDQGLINACTIKPAFDYGAALETAVFIYLRRIYSSIFYYKTSTGKEIDFLVENAKGEKILIQVCKTINSDKTRDREVSALIEAGKELESNRLYIIMLENTIKEDEEKHPIIFFTSWQFCLAFPETA
jgi:hypothetical protein